MASTAARSRRPTGHATQTLRYRTLSSGPALATATVTAGANGDAADGATAAANTPSKSAIATDDVTTATTANAPRSSASPQSWWTTRLGHTLVLVLFAAVGIAVRAHRLSDPDSVVFDEVHFGGQAAHYLTRTFFFDVHPPLGKLIFAAVGYLAGFDGSFRFEAIGLPYPPGVPYTAMRYETYSDRSDSAYALTGPTEFGPGSLRALGWCRR